MQLHSEWDPTAPRSDMNFNPFQTNDDGNACDPSGFYPGDTKYKDPIRGDMNWEIMQKERAFMDDIMANPKAGDTPTCPGRNLK